ncbi:uncharacterized protein LOC129145082 isoform X1 [Talpa occidentalis]|uniref:uncharacterized protein LOC129145082 isoform X1 n=1 Tax=Talpa occidentalis TaxID=50954 RepID=UPI0023F72C79|nr:uncharacterized protein LOC129145082 isoform X1 [Talpa occidentalis]
MHYWPFATSDLYNWRAQNARFSDNPKDLVNLLDTVLFTHQPTWDDCQQLLQVLFTTEERDRILTAARKLVPGEDGTPTTNAARIDLVFPLTRPDWDFNQAEGKERLRVYRQTLMAGLRAAARKPTNLAKVGDVQQGREETPAAFLERLMEAFRQYTPMDPEATENRAAVVMAFVNQAAPDIKQKLQRIDRLGEKSIRDLMEVAEKVYNRRETPEQREDRIRQEERKVRAAENARHTRDMARILFAVTQKDNPGKLHPSRRPSSTGTGRTLQRDQCAYCTQKGHWAKHCPKKRGITSNNPAVSDTPVLVLGGTRDDSD